jgi:hypothetical protein
MQPQGSLPCSQEPFHWPLSWDKSILSITFHHISPRSILLLSSFLCLTYSGGLFPSSFTTKFLYTFIFTSTCATFSAHLVLFDWILLIIRGEECKLWSPSLCSFLQPHTISSFLGRNILLSILLSNTLSLRSSLDARDQVSHPHRTTDTSDKWMYGDSHTGSSMSCSASLFYLWFVCHMFNDASNCSDYVVSSVVYVPCCQYVHSDRSASKQKSWMNWKECGKRWLRPNFKVLPRSFLKGIKKTTKPQPG